jgi:hypothetical protein
VLLNLEINFLLHRFFIAIFIVEIIPSVTMKPFFVKQFLLVVSCIASGFAVHAQKEADNIIKLNVPALFFKNFSLQYEKAVAKKQSFAVAVRYRPEGKIPFQGTVEDLVDDKSIRIDLARIGNVGITPEYRFYFGKKGVTNGFYIGPFISYNYYKGNVPINYNDYDDVNHVSIEKTAVFKGSVNTFTAGFQAGAQWKLSDKISLDWWIVGPNYGISKGTFDFVGTLNDIEQISMQYELEKIKNTIPLIKINIADGSPNANGATFKVNGPWAGIRAMGINIGYRF